MMDDVVGAWRLRSFDDLDESGRHREGPLGPAPDGLLIYSLDGSVSVSMMRGGGRRPGDEDGRHYMSYAGTWHRRGDRMVHRIEVAPEPSWIGLDQVRDLRLEGDHLVLTGHGPSGATARRMLRWERVPRDQNLPPGRSS
jgi:hypothetical protein